jgi:hypothetical protein
MSIKLLTQLVPFSSNTQLVINKIAEILIYELENQQKMAALIGNDADDYNIRVYTDRSDPLDQFKDDKTALVNVELADNIVDLKATAIYGRQHESVTINLYIYALGQARETTTGHIPADYDASQKVKKVRNVINRILRADINSNLQLNRHIVNSVIIDSAQYLTPDFNNREYGSIVAMRIALRCNVIEEPLINFGVKLESIVIDIEKDTTGRVYTTLEYTT